MHDLQEFQDRRIAVPGFATHGFVDVFHGYRTLLPQYLQNLQFLFCRFDKRLLHYEYFRTIYRANAVQSIFVTNFFVKIFTPTLLQEKCRFRGTGDVEWML